MLYCRQFRRYQLEGEKELFTFIHRFLCISMVDRGQKVEK